MNDVMKAVKNTPDIHDADVQKSRDKFTKSSRGKFLSTSNDVSQNETLKNIHKRMWRNEDIAKHIMGVNSFLGEIADPANRAFYGTLIEDFTGPDYTHRSWKLSSIVKQAINEEDEDYRMTKKLQECEEGHDTVDCDKTGHQFSNREISAFKKYMKGQQDILNLAGVVDEDGMVTLYRTVKDDEGTITKGDASYKGSYAESWTLNPAMCDQHERHIAMETPDEIMDSVSTYLLTARVPVENVISSHLSDPSDDEFDGVDASFNYNYPYTDEREVIVNSTDLQVTSYRYNKGGGVNWKRALAEQEELQTITTDDPINLDWLRITPEEVTDYYGSKKEQRIAGKFGDLDERFATVFEITNEDYGAGFAGTPELLRKLIKDTPYATEPIHLKKQAKGESDGCRRSKRG